jgi:hypothetical protein
VPGEVRIVFAFLVTLSDGRHYIEHVILHLADGEIARQVEVTVDPAAAPIVQRIFNDIAVGGSARQIALALTRDGIPTPSGRSKAWHVSTIRG